MKVLSHLFQKSWKMRTSKQFTASLIMTFAFNLFPYQKTSSTNHHHCSLYVSNRAFDSDSIDSEISEISDIFWYRNIGIDSAQYRYFRYFQKIYFFILILHFLNSALSVILFFISFPKKIRVRERSSITFLKSSSKFASYA
jgi:hypothetical protein